MGFASAWLAERSLFPRLINERPVENTGLIVVVPAYNEPGISTLLDSLAACHPPECDTEVIIVINAPCDADESEIINNERCQQEIEAWKNNESTFFKLYAINTGRSELKDWGVGLARKTGMDEALRRFDDTDDPEGVIVCLDADCKVAKNYFQVLERDFLLKKNHKACSIYFEHQLPGDDLTRSSIVQYELHLRYYLQGQLFSGFPYAYHTVGSSMAVRASSYLKCGGMNRKQAGEDFYFIQKLAGAGGYLSLCSTTVYPSARQSYRVPFGTGAMMRKMAEGTGDVLYTYNIKAFLELKAFFDSIDSLRLCADVEMSIAWNKLGPGLKQFIDEKEFIGKITEIRENTSGPESFRKRFFNWFNMFRIVRYLNSSHQNIFDKQPVVEAAVEMARLRALGTCKDDALSLLQLYRETEKC